MGATPVADNQIIDLFDGFIKASMTGGNRAAEAFLAANPTTSFLEAPVVSIFTNAIIGYISGLLFKQAGDMIATAVLDAQTFGEESAVANAVKQKEAAKAGGNQNAIDAANDILANAMGNLVHSDGFANPGRGPSA